MRLIRFTIFVYWLLPFSNSQAGEEHPWLGIAHASIFPQRLLDHRDEHGWSDLRLSVFRDAKYAYERRSPVAERLLYTFLWLDLMHEPESEYVPEWIAKMDKANRLHSNMPAEIHYTPNALGDRLSDAFLRFFFSRADLMRAAFKQWDATDLLTEVFDILDRLYSNKRYAFTQHPGLAFATAFVHDVPPPPNWPHSQVGQSVLPRTLRLADEVFEFYTNPGNARWFHSSIKRLSIAEAVFLVDLMVSPTDVEWVRQHVAFKPENYEEAYNMVRYDNRRIQAGQYFWMYDDYSLPAIHRAGGICVDQAYFASQAGKVQGLPTIEFLGSGMDGRHAWFGYLDPRGKWNMDAGRYADQRLVTGYAFNPQTWSFISDHEVAFLGSGVQEKRQYFSSQLHLYWARLYSHLNELSLAEKAAADAVAIEPRNDEAWSLLIHIRKQLDAPVSRVDTTYRSALSALRIYSDLEAKLLAEFADHLETTGRQNVAQAQRRRITFKNKDGRSDLAVKSVVKILEDSMREDSCSAQMYVYKRVLHQLGDQGGIRVFDEVVVPFVSYLVGKGRQVDARSALLEAERVLKPAVGSQMAKGFQKLKGRVGV